MSALVDRITEVLRDEANEVVFGESNNEAWLRLAERVAEALQLTEELRVTEDGEQVSWPPSMKHALDVVKHPIGDAEPGIERRWVSAWTAVEPKP